MKTQLGHMTGCKIASFTSWLGAVSESVTDGQYVIILRTYIVIRNRPSCSSPRFPPFPSSSLPGDPHPRTRENRAVGGCCWPLVAVAGGIAYSDMYISRSIYGVRSTHVHRGGQAVQVVIDDTYILTGATGCTCMYFAGSPVWGRWQCQCHDRSICTDYIPSESTTAGNEPQAHRLQYFSWSALWMDDPSCRMQPEVIRTWTLVVVLSH